MTFAEVEALGHQTVQTRPHTFAVVVLRAFIEAHRIALGCATIGTARTTRVARARVFLGSLAQIVTQHVRQTRCTLADVKLFAYAERVAGAGGNLAWIV